jgi:hypothetical protein
MNICVVLRKLPLTLFRLLVLPLPSSLPVHSMLCSVLRYSGMELAEHETSPWPALSRVLPSGSQHPWRPDLMEMPRLPYNCQHSR